VSVEASVGIVSFEQQYEMRSVGSSRIRVHWPLKYWPEAELFRIGRHYGTLIFQKVYWLEYGRRFKGTRIFDLCDPDFLYYETYCARMMDACDAVTCPTQALADCVARLTRTPVHVIPDRLDLEAIQPWCKQHRGPMRTAAWFGYAANFPMLDTIVEALPRHGVSELIVITNAGASYEMPPPLRVRLTVTNLVWSDEGIYQDLCRADVVLNPRSSELRWRFKSMNKTTLAWGLGLPVAHHEGELSAFVAEQARETEGQRRRLEVRATCDVRTSVAEYRALIAGLEPRLASRRAASTA
jgi:hypothetical protein